MKMSGSVFALILALFCANMGLGQSLSTVPDPIDAISPLNPVGSPEVVNYLYDDGTVDDGIGITGTNPFDIIWLNRFDVQPGGEIITDIKVAIGSPSDTRPYNGLPISILLYNDSNGGSVTDAVLVNSARIDTTVANANTGLLNTYDIPDTLVSTQFLVGALMRNLPGGQGFVAGFDDTPPSTTDASFAGFTVGAPPLNESDLASIPSGQFGTIEGFGLPGNWVVRATGIMVPEPTSLGLLAMLGLGLSAAMRRR